MIGSLADQSHGQVTYARVLDANRKFIDAAMRYYELSQTQHAEVVQDDLLEVIILYTQSLVIDV